MNVFIVRSPAHSPPGVLMAIHAAVSRVLTNAEVTAADAFTSARSLNLSVHDSIVRSDIVIVDVTGSSPNVMYELGVAVAAEKPVVIIASSSSDIPFDVAGMRFLVYDADQLDWFVDVLAEWIRIISNDPEWVRRDEPSVPTAFLSYSHADAEYLDRLRVHLRPLEREGLLEIWADTQLRAGDRWKEEIEKALKRAGVAVLLISADFLASEFILTNELPPLLKGAESAGTRIVPVILKPCRFLRDHRLSQFQAINDPMHPVAGLPDVDREAVFDAVAEVVERSVSRPPVT